MTPSPSQPRKIIIDTDPGQDDAFAILLALASPEDLEVLGICAVAGNVPLALTERNARVICELAGKPEMRVFAGCAKIASKTFHITPLEILQHNKHHKESVTPEPNERRPGYSVRAIYQTQCWGQQVENAS